MTEPCAICGQPIDCVRKPSPGHVFAHGACVGRPVLIYEYRETDCICAEIAQLGEAQNIDDDTIRAICTLHITRLAAKDIPDQFEPDGRSDLWDFHHFDLPTPYDIRRQLGMEGDE